MGNVQRPEYDSTDTPVVNEPTWLSKIHDKTSIADLSVVGTHDSLLLFGGDSIQTQSWTLEKQLRAGIRALDIHVKHTKEDLLVHNGSGYYQTTFDNIENICIEFLKENTSEFILVNIQKLEDEEPHERTFYNEMKYRAEKSAFYWRGNGMPNVGQVRGRVVLLGNMAYGISSQYIVSCIEVPPAPTLFQLQSVWTMFFKHLGKKVPKNILRYTIVSSSSAGVFPYTSARSLNDWFMENLALYELPLGIVWFDYPGNGLITKVIGLNTM